MKKVLLCLLLSLSIVLIGCTNEKNRKRTGGNEPIIAYNVESMIRVKVTNVIAENVSFDNHIKDDQSIYECEVLEVFNDYYSKLYKVYVGGIMKIVCPVNLSKFININDEFIGSFYAVAVKCNYVNNDTLERHEIDKVFNILQYNSNKTNKINKILYIPIKNEKVYITPIIEEGFDYSNLQYYDNKISYINSDITLKFHDGMTLEQFRQWTKIVINHFPSR